ncbi:MAG TPA: rhodanese-like domain-containing protein [Candidatus Acidoferrales bacterium]|nr:rhodanese-like domain-containing protein [Candidatus Acidoferrales bacterium]
MKFMILFLMAVLPAACVAQSQSGGASGVPSVAIPKPNAVLVIETPKRGVTPQQIIALIEEEVRATVKLYLDGKIREWYSRGDGKGVIFLVDAKTEDEARTIMETLPLAKEQLIDHEYIPVGPLMPLRTLMGAGPQTGRAIGAKQIAPEDLRKLVDKNTKTLIIDVRDPDAFEKETIKGAINIPLVQLEAKLRDIPKDTTLVFTCNTGIRSSEAAKLAEQAGFKTATFCPINEWKEKGNPTEAGVRRSASH